MKTDRFFLTRTAATLLAALLLVPVLSQAAGFHVGKVRVGIDVDRPSRKWAKALAPQVQEVQRRFDDGRRALSTVKGADGKPAYLRKDVADLIDHTGRDLDDAIVKVQPSDLQPLRDWAADEIGRIQGEIKGPQGQTAALPAGLFAPQPVEVIASLGNPPKKKPASPKAAKPAAPPAPPPDTVPADKSNGILDEVGKVVSRIFTLADKDDLEVKLWVGSTAPHTTFSFWPGGKIKGSTLAPTIIRTDGKKGGVVRGLYDYRAAWTQGKVTQIIQYPQPAGAQSTPTERLDLVNGTGFFCCRFNEQYCHAINNEKECRP
jgi:hypothetical protein